MRDIINNDIRKLDGTLLLIFRGLLRLRQTTAVASELGLSQSAVSHALARLRRLFGDPLFVRRPRGLEPTRRALDLGPRVDALLDIVVETLGRDSAFNPATSRRQFVFSAPEFIAGLLGPRLIARFGREAPSASFAIDYLGPEQALAALTRGRLDLALGRFDALPGAFVGETVYSDRYCVVARAGHRKLKGRITQSQYNATGHVYAHAESEVGQAERGTSTAVMRAAVPRWLTVLEMIATSDAIATVPRKLAMRYAGPLKLQILKPPFEPFKIEVSAVRPAGRADAGVEWLLGCVREALE
jgi:DNA-binding transcriptional LysR family regulator